MDPNLTQTQGPHTCPAKFPGRSVSCIEGRLHRGRRRAAACKLSAILAWRVAPSLTCSYNGCWWGCQVSQVVDLPRSSRSPSIFWLKWTSFFLLWISAETFENGGSTAVGCGQFFGKGKVRRDGLKRKMGQMLRQQKNQSLACTTHPLTKALF